MTYTAYELADLALSAQAAASPTFALFLTITSGYLIVAWLAGDRLTRAQVNLISLLFLFFQLMLVYGWVIRWAFSHDYFTALSLVDPTYKVGPGYLIWLFAIVMLASIPGCLKFMWDVRHPKTG